MRLSRKYPSFSAWDFQDRPPIFKTCDVLVFIGACYSRVMHFLIYPTERCNLQCRYCDTPQEKACQVKDRQYDIKALVDFLKQDPKPGVTFYGGEPTLDVDFMVEVMDRTRLNYTSMVTNTFFLDKLPIRYIKRMDMISMSIDGSKDTTDFNRGQGVHDMVIRRARWLKEEVGFTGLTTARMTVALDTDIEKEVKYLASTGLFDLVHWQLDVFHQYSLDKTDEYEAWFEQVYNPGISRLVEWWADEILKSGKVHRLVPFIGVMYDLLTGRKESNIRCGAGSTFWVINTKGEVYVCPVLRDLEEFKVSDITRPITDIKPQFLLKSPCTECDIFRVCGGRCIVSNHYARDKPIFKMVCQTVRHLVLELQKVRPEIEAKIRAGKLDVEKFNYFFEHEVIP